MIPGIILEKKPRIVWQKKKQTNEKDTERFHSRSNFQYSQEKLRHILGSCSKTVLCKFMQFIPGKNLPGEQADADLAEHPLA